MTTRLSILFNGSPEEGSQTFREVVGTGYKSIPFSHLARWRRASREGEIWSLDVDTLPLDRPRLVYILPVESAGREDVEAAVKDITVSNSIPLYPHGENDLEASTRRKLRKDCVEICDRMLVLNVEKSIDKETQEIIDFASEIGRHTVYLNY